MNEEDFYDEGYSRPAKVYRKGLSANFYEGENLTETKKEDDKMKRHEFMARTDRLELFWDSDEMAKLAGDPVYLLEHNDEPKWIDGNSMHGYTNNADHAWFTCDREKAEAIIKNEHSVFQDLPIHVSEHIFEAL